MTLSTPTNFMRSAMQDGTVSMYCVNHIRAELVWLRDYMDKHEFGDNEERALLNELCADLAVFISWAPEEDQSCALQSF